MLLQPFVNYNLRHGWYLTSSPIITSNWEVSNNRWTVLSRKDCSLRKDSYERLCPGLSKRGASGRHNKLVRKISDAVSISKEVTECRYEKQERNGRVI